VASDRNQTRRFSEPNRGFAGSNNFRLAQISIYRPWGVYCYARPNSRTSLTSDEFARPESVFRYLVPKLEDRQPISTASFPLILLPTFSLLFLSYLARRPNTYLARLAFLPFIIWASLRAAFAYYNPDPEQNSANFSKGTSANPLAALAEPNV
jgi:hypothetical protein